MVAHLLLQSHDLRFDPVESLLVVDNLGLNVSAPKDEHAAELSRRHAAVDHSLHLVERKT
ncbi:MAG: hypothetical protein R2706_12390 [Acidimicrobiales bacterium]